MTSLVLLPRPTEIRTTLSSALNEWKSARTLLSETIRSYAAACAVLRAAYASAAHDPVQRSATEETCITIDSALETLASNEQTLYNARMSLGTVRNQSTTLVRVNLLPREILGVIFSLSKIRCVEDNGFESRDISATCVLWRQISLKMPDLWTHIDIYPHIPINITSTLLERTGNCLVHIHLRELKGRMPVEPWPMPQHKNGQIVALLEAHAHRIQSLDLASHDDFRELTDAIVDLWLARGKASLPRGLLARRLHPAGPNGSVRSLPGGIQPRSAIDRVDSQEAPLISLRRLHLATIMFNWGIGTYNHLVDLRMEFTPYNRGIVAISQLAQVLSESTRISILKLQYVTINTSREWKYAGPIALKYLNVLSLSSLPNPSMNALLPLLTLSAPGAQCAISGFRFEVICDELASFFARSQIATLYFCPGESVASLSWLPLLKLYSHMKTLILGYVFFSGNAYIERGSQLPIFEGPAVSSTVILSRGVVTLSGLRGLIDNHGVLDLRLDMCTPNPQNTPVMGLQGIQATLLREYPNLRCSVSEKDSTSQLACRTMFSDNF